MKSRSNSFVYHLAIDVPIVVLVTAIITILELGYVTFPKSGYFCQDPSISFVFTKDTVTMPILLISIVFFPILIMWPVEFALFRPSDYSIKTNRLLESLKAAARWYRDYFYGLVLNVVLVEVMKLSLGRPRPCFLDVCEPDNMHTCVKGTFVPDYTCTSKRFSTHSMLDSSRSFPSGHTSLGVNTGLFIVWYLQRRAFSWRSRTVMLVPLLQVLSASYAIVCGLTRITDHRHHWSDVLAGAVVGVIATAYSAVVLCKNFSCPSTTSSSDLSSNGSSTHNNHPSVRRLLSSGGSTHTLPHAHIADMP